MDSPQSPADYAPPSGSRAAHGHRSSQTDFRANGSNGPVPVPHRPPGLQQQQQQQQYAPSHARGGSGFGSQAAAGPSAPLARSPPNKNTSHVPCKFFKQGNCQAGNACPFDHSIDPEPPCKYFMKGNCKFGAKCALAHILPDGRRVNKPHLPHMGGGRSQFYQAHADQQQQQQQQQQQGGFGHGHGGHASQYSQPYPGPDELARRDQLSNMDGTFGSPPGSNFGSPPADGRLAFSPKGLTALETPFPASFDSTSISLVAQHHKKFGESVPTSFGGWGTVNSTSPTTSAAHHHAFGNLNSLARPEHVDASSPPSGNPLLSPRLRTADAQPRHIMQPDRRAAGFNIAHSMGARPMAYDYSLGKKPDDAIIDEDDDDQLAFEEDLVPHSLSELLTPQEKMRRFSRSEQDHGLSSRPPRSGYGSPPDAKFGSPSHNSPSRYGALFASRQQRNEDSEGPRASPFGHVGSPLRNSSFGGRAGEGDASPGGLGALVRPGKSGDMAASPGGLGLISEQLRKARLGGDGPASPGLQPPAAPVRTVSGSSVGSQNERVGRLDRAMSSTSVGRERIDEEDYVFDMEDDEVQEGPRDEAKNLGPLSGVGDSGGAKAWADVAAGRAASGGSAAARSNGTSTHAGVANGRAT